MTAGTRRPAQNGSCGSANLTLTSAEQRTIKDIIDRLLDLNVGSGRLDFGFIAVRVAAEMGGLSQEIENQLVTMAGAQAAIDMGSPQPASHRSRLSSAAVTLGNLVAPWVPHVLEALAYLESYDMIRREPRPGSRSFFVLRGVCYFDWDAPAV